MSRPLCSGTGWRGVTIRRQFGIDFSHPLSKEISDRRHEFLLISQLKFAQAPISPPHIAPDFFGRAHGLLSVFKAALA
jgi:hypothetical protein